MVCLTELVITPAGKETREAEKIAQTYNDQYCKMMKHVLKSEVRALISLSSSPENNFFTLLKSAKSHCISFGNI